MGYKLLLFFVLYSALSFSKERDLIDDPDKEWCYLKKSTTVIGMPFNPQVTEVTYDGSLYTGYSELSFSYGQADIPILLRQKTFYEGWIPVVNDTWYDGKVRYRIEMFSAPLEIGDVSNCVNFVKVRMTNTGNKKATACLNVSARGRLDDYRLAKLKGFSSQSKFEIRGNALYRDGKLLFAFSEGVSKIESVKGTAYRSSFVADSLGIKEDTRTGILYYVKPLNGGESFDVVLKMPAVPVDNLEYISKLQHSQYDVCHDFVVDFWKKIILSDTYFEIPEKRIQDAQRASIAHMLLATRTFPDRRKMQTDGIPYPNFFLTSAPHMAMAYLTNGCSEYAKLIVRNALLQQEPDGLYFDKSLAHGGIIPTAHGHIMYMAAAYYLLTRDTDFGKKIFPSLKKAVEYLERETENNKYGLLPPTYPYDNEMIDGYYACNNYWALLGLRFCIRMAKDLKQDEVLQRWQSLEKAYTRNILKAVHTSVRGEGYVPAGFYDFKTGKQARRGFNEYQCNNDWENMLLAYPTELLPPGHQYLSSTLEHIRRGYAEGIMTYRHGQHLHQYITANLIEQYMVQGEQRQALIDFYHLILHSGSTHEGFENLVIPWKDRMVNPHCPTPHAWASAKIAFLIRNFLLHEYGGRAGLEKERCLFLYPVVSPEWAKPGQRLLIHDALTEMGRVTSEIKFAKGSAHVTYKATYNDYVPYRVKIRIPYFKEVVSFETDALDSYIEDGCIVLSPDFTVLDIKWNDNEEVHRATSEYILKSYRACDTFEGVDTDGVQIIKKHRAFLLDDEKKNKIEPLNFDLVKKCFLKEFDRRSSLRE